MAIQIPCLFAYVNYLAAVVIVPGVSATRHDESLVDFDVEKYESGERKYAQQNRSCNVHIVLDVNGVITGKNISFHETTYRKC